MSLLLRSLPFLCSGLLLGSCSTQKYVAAKHPNGKPQVEIHVKGKGEDAVKVMEKVYYSTGQLEYIGRFKNGVEHGEWRYLQEDGTLKFVENWQNGVEHGIHYDYSPDGRIYRELHFDQGRIVNEVDRSK